CFQGAGPEGSEPVAARDAVGLYVGKGPIVEVGTRIELRVQAALEELGRKRLLRGKGIAHARVDAVVRVSIAGRVIAEVGRIPYRVEACALPMACLHHESPRIDRARGASGDEARGVGTVAGRRIGGEPFACTSGEYLDHAANGVRTVQTCGRAAQDLDVVDEV